MTYEAVKLTQAGITTPGRPISFTIPNTISVEKGTIMKMSGAYTAGISSAIGDVFAGIANSAKVISDGSTTLGLDTCGVFDCYVTGGVVVGDYLEISGANILRPMRVGVYSGASMVTGTFVGKALETSAAADTIAVAVGVY